MQKTSHPDRAPVVTKAERRWVLWFALIGMLVTTIPYILGFAFQGEGWNFTGFVFAVEDGNSYIAKMLSGAAGAWLFRTPYTAFPQHGVLAFLPYLLLGKLTSPPGQHEQLVALFQLYRFGAGLLAILAMYDFIAYFVKDVRLRRWGVALAAFGGGLGWVLILLGRENWLGSLPLGFYSPESFGFLSLYGLPHLAMARALLMWGLLSYLGTPGAENAGRKSPAFGGFLWLVMGFFQPLTVPIAWAVMGAHLAGFGAATLWRTPNGESRDFRPWLIYFRRALVSGLISSPIVLYTFWAFSTDPFLQTWTAQNRILSPHPWHYLFAYGLLLPFAAFGLPRLLRENPLAGWLPASWIAVLPVLAYAPYNLQRRLPEGVWVAIIVLAVKALDFHPPEDPSRRLNRSILLFPLLFITPLLLLAGGIITTRNPGRPAFLPSTETAVFEALGELSVPGDVVLAAFDTGNALPAWAPVRVVIGHGPESVNLQEIRPMVASFFSPDSSDAERRALLAMQGVNYVFWGPSERALGNWNPHGVEYLETIYESGNYSLFAVQIP